MNLLTKDKNKILILIITLLFVVYGSKSIASKTAWYTNKSEWNALMKATYKCQYKKMVRIIKKNKIDPNYETSDWGLTALEIAIRKSDSIAFDILIGSDKIKKKKNDKYIKLASYASNSHIIKGLIKYGYTIDTSQDNLANLLIDACKYGSLEVVKYLLEINANPNVVPDNSNMSALIAATYNGKLEIVRLLLKMGAEKSYKDKNGDTAIDFVKYIPTHLNIDTSTKQKIKELLEKK